MRQKMARARRVGGARSYICLSKFEVRGNGAERRRLVQTECWCPRDVIDGSKFLLLNYFSSGVYGLPVRL